MNDLHISFLSLTESVCVSLYVRSGWMLWACCGWRCLTPESALIQPTETRSSGSSRNSTGTSCKAAVSRQRNVLPKNGMTLICGSRSGQADLGSVCGLADVLSTCTRQFTHLPVA